MLGKGLHMHTQTSCWYKCKIFKNDLSKFALMLADKTIFLHQEKNIAIQILHTKKEKKMRAWYTCIVCIKLNFTHDISME